ncbi:MAG: hypothetical protein RR235_07990 [Oscillospiraceae bacterium]
MTDNMIDPYFIKHPEYLLSEEEMAAEETATENNSGSVNTGASVSVEASTVKAAAEKHNKTKAVNSLEPDSLRTLVAENNSFMGKIRKPGSVDRASCINRLAMTVCAGSEMKAAEWMAIRPKEQNAQLYLDGPEIGEFSPTAGKAFAEMCALADRVMWAAGPKGIRITLSLDGNWI